MIFCSIRDFNILLKMTHFAIIALTGCGAVKFQCQQSKTLKRTRTKFVIHRLPYEMGASNQK